MTAMTELALTPGTEDAALTALDRCDKCSAQAFVRVRMKSGALDFCGHHYVEMELQLTAQGAAIEVDSRSLINVKPSESSA